MMKDCGRGVLSALCLVVVWSFMDWLGYHTNLWTPTIKDYWLAFWAAFASGAMVSGWTKG